MQYVGKTVDEFRLRWNNYKDNNRKYFRKESWMHQHLFEHFPREGHNSFVDDISMIFIDKTNPKDPNKRELYWTHMEMAPQRLNVEDDWFLQFCFTYISHAIYSYNLDLYLWRDSLIKNGIPYFLMLRGGRWSYY